MCRQAYSERAEDASHRDEKQVQAGTPWRAEPALDVIAMLDQPAWAALACAHRRVSRDPWRIDGLTERQTQAIDAQAFTFITGNADIAMVRDFMGSLPDRLQDVVVRTPNADACHRDLRRRVRDRDVPQHSSRRPDASRRRRRRRMAGGHADSGHPGRISHQHPGPCRGRHLLLRHRPGQRHHRRALFRS